MEKKNGSDPTQGSGRNMPPAVYRPFRVASQPKTASLPSRSGPPPVYCPLGAASVLKPAGAPPAYRPSVLAFQLQWVGALQVYRPTGGAQTGAGAQMKPRASAPPVYRPQPAQVQPERGGAAHGAPPVYRPQVTLRPGPPVYRPGATVQGKSQISTACHGASEAPPIYRPQVSVPPGPPVYRPFPPAMQGKCQIIADLGARLSAPTLERSPATRQSTPVQSAFPAAKALTSAAFGTHQPAPVQARQTMFDPGTPAVRQPLSVVQRSKEVVSNIKETEETTEETTDETSDDDAPSLKEMMQEIKDEVADMFDLNEEIAESAWDDNDLIEPLKYITDSSSWNLYKKEMVRLAVGLYFKQLAYEKNAPGSGGSSGWASNKTRTRARELVKLNFSSGIFLGNTYTIHHKISQKKLKILESSIKNAKKEGEFLDVLEKKSLKKALLNFPANLEVGPYGDKRVGDPGSGFDPNLDDGEMTPRSEKLNVLDSLIGTDKWDSMIKILIDVKNIQDNEYGGKISPPKLKQWSKDKNNKFKRESL